MPMSARPWHRHGFKNRIGNRGMAKRMNHSSHFEEHAGEDHGPCGGRLHWASGSTCGRGQWALWWQKPQQRRQREESADPVSEDGRRGCWWSPQCQRSWVPAESPRKQWPRAWGPNRPWWKGRTWGLRRSCVPAQMPIRKYIGSASAPRTRRRGKSPGPRMRRSCPFGGRAWGCGIPSPFLESPTRGEDDHRSRRRVVPREELIPSRPML